MSQRNKGKSKGSAYERDFCKRLSLWFTGGKNAKAFWRSPSSGAMATQSAGKDCVKFTQGDVIGCSPEAVELMENVTIELKRGYKYDFIDLVAKNFVNSCLMKFYTQLNEEMHSGSSEFGFLVLKQDRKSEVVVMPEDTFAALYGNGILMCRAYAQFVIWSTCMYAVSLDAFFKMNPAAFYFFVTRKEYNDEVASKFLS